MTKSESPTCPVRIPTPSTVEIDQPNGVDMAVCHGCGQRIPANVSERGGWFFDEHLTAEASAALDAEVAR